MIAGTERRADSEGRDLAVTILAPHVPPYVTEPFSGEFTAVSCQDNCWECALSGEIFGGVNQ